MGFQSGIRAAVYWVHVGSAFLIWALPTVLPVSNLALQRFCPEAKSLSSTECLFPLKWIVAGVLARDRLEKSAYEWPTSHCFSPVFVFFFLPFILIFHSVSQSFSLFHILYFSLCCYVFTTLWSLFCLPHLLWFSFILPLCSPCFLSRSRCSTLISHKTAAWADENSKRQQQEQGQHNHINPARHLTINHIKQWNCQNIQIRFRIWFIGNAFVVANIIPQILLQLQPLLSWINLTYRINKCAHTVLIP